MIDLKHAVSKTRADHKTAISEQSSQILVDAESAVLRKIQRDPFKSEWTYNHFCSAGIFGDHNISLEAICDYINKEFVDRKLTQLTVKVVRVSETNHRTMGSLQSKQLAFTLRMDDDEI